MQDKDYEEQLRVAVMQLSHNIEELDRQANGPTHRVIEAVKEACRIAANKVEELDVRLGKSKASFRNYFR